jgi:hypothetical protein
MIAGQVERAQAAGNLPVDSSVYAFPNDGPYFTIVYGQGARFLHEVRRQIGDDAFEASLREYVETFSDKQASPRALLDIFQRRSSANLNPLIWRFFSYDAYADPQPPSWSIQAPNGTWRGSARLSVEAPFSISKVEVWLDNRLLYSGAESSTRLDLSGVEPGSYALLVRVWDQRGIQLERARRVTVG